MNTKLEISLKKSQDGLSVSAQATREIQSGSKSQKTEQNSEDYLYVELSVKFSPGYEFEAHRIAEKIQSCMSEIGRPCSQIQERY